MVNDVNDDKFIVVHDQSSQKWIDEHPNKDYSVIFLNVHLRGANLDLMGIFRFNTVLVLFVNTLISKNHHSLLKQSLNNTVVFLGFIAFIMLG